MEESYYFCRNALSEDKIIETSAIFAAHSYQISNAKDRIDVLVIWYRLQPPANRFACFPPCFPLVQV